MMRFLYQCSVVKNVIILNSDFIYHKSIKFFGYNKHHSVTAGLIDLKLPSVNTVIRDLRYMYNKQWWSACNMLIVNFRNINLFLICSRLAFFIVYCAFVCRAS